MSRINIMASRHSPFYSPLLACIDGGFLSDEGVESGYSVATPDATVPDGLRDGSVQLGQLAVSASWGLLENGVQPHFMHFAQINERDGFFLAARNAIENFDWQHLAGCEVLVDHLGQPMALFKFAAALAGLDLSDVEILDCGEPDEMDAVFRGGVGDFIHLQGGAPQQLEKEGLATVRGNFPDLETDVLTATIDRYKRLGCWTPNVDISRESYAAALSAFQATGGIRHDYPYEQVVVPPPG